MDLGIKGKLPKVFSKSDLEWLRSYLDENGDRPPNKQLRSHLSNFHKGWDPVNQFLKSHLHPVIGNDFEFCYALANTGKVQDNVIHTDICLRFSTLPKGMPLPPDKESYVYYTFLVIEEYEHNFGNHKPCTYLFDRMDTRLENDALNIIEEEDIDMNLPILDVSERTKKDLCHLPFEIVRRMKILDVIDQDPLCVNYWQSYVYHVTNSYTTQGVKYKKFFNIMARKKI